MSVAKAGLVASLPARTAIMAAANPVEGHYNRARTIADNLKMSPAMLSRWGRSVCGGDRGQPCVQAAVPQSAKACHSLLQRAHACGGLPFR